MAEETYNKFSDSRLFFSFLFKSQKTGVLNISEVEEIKRDFIAQKNEIMSLFQEGRLENDHDYLISLLKNYLSAKNKFKNFTQQVIKIEGKETEALENVSNQKLNKFSEGPIQNSSMEISGTLSNEKESFICFSQNLILKSFIVKNDDEGHPRKHKRCHTQSFAGKLLHFSCFKYI